MNSKIFPPNAKQFRLRCDFSFEIGFAEQARDLLVHTSSAPRPREGIDLPADREDRLFEWRIELYSPPRFLTYFSAFGAGENQLLRYIGDGYFYVPIVEPGAIELWNEMLNRFESRDESGAVNPCIIAATKPPKSPESWGVPDFVVVHDTTAGVAAVISWEMSFEYLKLNPKRD